MDDDELLKITTTSPAANVELGTVCPAVTDKTLPTSPTTSVFVELLDTGTFLYPTGLVPSTVQLLSVPDVGVPSTGVTKVGDVAKTKEPEPVSSVTAAAKLDEEGVPNQVCTPVPKLAAVMPLANDKLPEPSVDRNCPAVPSVPGIVNVVFDEVFADWTVVVPVPDALP